MTVKVYMLDTAPLLKAWEEKDPAVDLLYASLSEKRQEKIQRFRYPKGKALSLGAGLLLDYGLGRHGLREREVAMAYGADEKPYLKDYPDIHFNLSHSGAMAMAAFADRQVGCDVEQEGKPDYRIVRRFFAPEEIRALEEQTEECKRARMFYRFWTLKESFLKVTGKGIRMPLNDFEGKPYGFKEFSLPGYQAALCVEGAEPGIFAKIQFLSWGPEGLV